MHRFRSLLVSATLAVLAACSGGTSSSQPASGAPAGQEVTVTVQPPGAWVQPGGTVNFASTVTGAADPSVAWAVVEPGGGTISETGVYTAPLTSGTYTVTATSSGKGKALGRSKVTVSPAPAPTVSISPADPTVAAGSSLAFTATVTGTTSTAVTWSVREASGCGSIDATGVYTAPAAGATCHVDVASVEAPSATASSTVTVSPPPAAAPSPVAVTISPSAGTVDACRTLTFTATVSTGGTVAWSVQEGSTGGSITSAGVYTAPATAGTYHVVATSQGATATVPVTVGAGILGVAVSPSTVSLAPGATAQFTATVTTTCGSFTSTQTVTAPN